MFKDDPKYFFYTWTTCTSFQTIQTLIANSAPAFIRSIDKQHVSVGFFISHFISVKVFQGSPSRLVLLKTAGRGKFLPISIYWSTLWINNLKN